MKTLSDRIRAAALGPVPSHDSTFLSSWIGREDLYSCRALFLDGWRITPFWHLRRNDDRRMALLFLAEAVK